MSDLFFTKYKRPQLQEGEVDPVSKVEAAGYIPADVQIEQFIIAGRRLDLARKEMFDVPPGEDGEPEIDPTRSGSFDLADASQVGRSVGIELVKQGKKKLLDQEKERQAKIEESKKEE